MGVDAPGEAVRVELVDAAVGGPGGMERIDPVALEEAADEADAAAVGHQQRGAPVQGAVAQTGQDAALLRLQALAAREPERLGVLAVVPPRVWLFAHDGREAAPLPLPAMRLRQSRVDDQGQVAAESRVDDLGGLARAPQVAGDDESDAAPGESFPLGTCLRAADIVESYLGPALAAGGFDVPVGLAVSQEEDQGVTARRRGAEGSATAQVSGT